MRKERANAKQLVWCWVDELADQLVDESVVRKVVLLVGTWVDGLAGKKAVCLVETKAEKWVVN